MIKVVSIRAALDRKGNEKERSLQNCLLSLWLCVILAAALTSFLFLFSIKTKNKASKKGFGSFL